MTPRNELRLLSRAIRDGDISPLLGRGVTSNWFSDTECRRLWDFIVQYHREYGAVPSTVTIKDNYPTQAILEVEDKIEYLVNELVACRRRTAITHMVRAS